MVTVKCKGSSKDTVKLCDLKPFQGDLKKRTNEDIEALKESILNEGLLMPFAIWLHDDSKWLLDGHGRYEALVRAALEEPSILEQEFPAIIIEASSEDEARKALLQITSAYGKFNKKGIVEFVKPIEGYRAPVIALTERAYKKRELKERDNGIMIKIKVPKDKVEEVKNIFKTVSYITLL